MDKVSLLVTCMPICSGLDFEYYPNLNSTLLFTKLFYYISLRSELLGIWWGLQNTTGMYNEADSTWFAVVYDGYRSVLTMYQDGNVSLSFKV